MPQNPSVAPQIVKPAEAHVRNRADPTVSTDFRLSIRSPRYPGLPNFKGKARGTSRGSRAASACSMRADGSEDGGGDAGGMRRSSARRSPQADLNRYGLRHGLTKKSEKYPTISMFLGSPTRTRTWIDRVTTGFPAVERSGNGGAPRTRTELDLLAGEIRGPCACPRLGLP